MIVKNITEFSYISKHYFAFPKIRESVLMQASLAIVCTVVMVGVYTINRSVDKAMRSFVKKLTSRK